MAGGVEQGSKRRLGKGGDRDKGGRERRGHLRGRHGGGQGGLEPPPKRSRSPSKGQASDCRCGTTNSEDNAY
ncbi:hypothetical protein E2C01_015336 [Portunus trituberculatus]|uniref:Uncharacterized protein n=1 Tax=Portunus trituberculatus TaxID=210409 RepID=A0A5B7DMA9_PORTR|nr:hypothetical protein [Portunus trituberculatus]